MTLTYADDTAQRLAALCALYLRPAASLATDTVTGPVLTFEPPLTTTEQTTYADLLSMAKAGLTASLTLTEYQALKPALATLRTQRTRTDSEWNALTAAQRDTQLIAWDRAITDVLRALLRD